METCTIHHKDTGVFLANEKKTKIVTLITLFTMIVEIIVGYWSGSMALLADGWHMASHTLALFLSLVVYYLYRHPKFKKSFTFGGGKILSLGGYTSSLFLIFIAGSMIYESATRFFSSHVIHYQEAIWVSIVGLVVNLICAWIMHSADEPSFHHAHQHNESCHHDHHHHAATKLSPIKNNSKHDHHHHHHDHNHESAYVHILTDAVTSVLAIVALLLGQYFQLTWLDPLVGLIGGVIVFKWSLSLIHQSGMDLLDAHDASIDRDSLVKKIESDGSKVIDIHLWKIAPGQIGCELIIKNNKNQMSSDYRDIIKTEFAIQHLVIEVV